MSMRPKLEQLAAESGVPLREIEEQFEYELAKQLKSGREVEEAEKQVFLKVRRRLKRRQQFPARVLESLTFIPLGDTGLVDRVSILSRIALRENRVDGEGRPIDFREKLFGRPNPNFGRPFGNQHDFYRFYWGVSRRDRESFKPARLELYGDYASAETFELLNPRNVLCRSKGNGVQVLRFGKGSFQSPRFEAFNLAEIIPTCYPILKLKELEGKTSQMPVFTRGYLIAARDTEGGAMLILDDESLDWKDRAAAFTSSTLPAGIKEDDELCIFGIPASRPNRITLRALGVYKSSVLGL